MFSKKEYYIARKLVVTVLDVQDFAMDNFKDLYISHFNDFDNYIGYDEKTMGEYSWFMRTTIFAAYFTFNVKVEGKSIRDLYVNDLLLKGKTKRAEWVAKAFKEYRHGIYNYKKEVSTTRSLLSTTAGPKQTFELIHLPNLGNLKNALCVFSNMVKIDGQWWSVSRFEGCGNMEADVSRYYELASKLSKDKHPWIFAKLAMEDSQRDLDKKVSAMFKDAS